MFITHFEVLYTRLLRPPCVELNNNCIILVSCETVLSTRATVFADCSVYFIYLHTRDNSRRSRSRVSFSRGATFLMQLAPFLPYKSHCGASRALRIHSTCIHIRIRSPRYSLHSRSNKECNPRPIYRRMKDDVQDPSKVLVVLIFQLYVMEAF